MCVSYSDDSADKTHAAHIYLFTRLIVVVLKPFHFLSSLRVTFYLRHLTGTSVTVTASLGLWVWREWPAPGVHSSEEDPLILHQHQYER